MNRREYVAQRTRAAHGAQAAPQRDPVPPADNPFRAIPAGRYGLFNKPEETWYLFQVDQPDIGKWAGFTFLHDVTNGHGWGQRVPVKDRAPREMILRAILANPLGAAEDYGKNNPDHECGKCGTPLTNPESIARGIGPICAQHYA